MYQFGDCVCPGPFQHGIYSLRAGKKKKPHWLFLKFKLLVLRGRSGVMEAPTGERWYCSLTEGKEPFLKMEREGGLAVSQSQTKPFGSSSWFPAFT